MPKRTDESRIKAEKKRLEAVYKDIPEEKAKTVAGLIDRASWQRVQLENLEADIQENGWASVYQQSPNLPSYERVRPQSNEYQKLNANYQRTIKQLLALLPKKLDEEEEDDGFDDFLKENEEPSEDFLRWREQKLKEKAEAEARASQEQD